jgi:hypothetical protein
MQRSMLASPPVTVYPFRVLYGHAFNAPGLLLTRNLDRQEAPSIIGPTSLRVHFLGVKSLKACGSARSNAAQD